MRQTKDIDPKVPCFSRYWLSFFHQYDKKPTPAHQDTGVACCGDLGHDKLASGALVRMFPQKVCPSADGEVCLIGPQDKWEDPKVRIFREWAVEISDVDRERCRVEGCVQLG